MRRNPEAGPSLPRTVTEALTGIPPGEFGLVLTVMAALLLAVLA
jgi:hypothetical protein